MRSNLIRKSILTTAILLPLLSSCDRQSQVQTSETKVTDVNHTPSKGQYVGNCWLYAAGSWAESLHLDATGQTVNLSESYWTFWHWYGQIVNRDIEKLETGGFWNTGMNIILKHGYMLEGDFIPEEAEKEFSKTQYLAEKMINEALGEEGALKSVEDRTPEKVMQLLESAFGVNMESLKDKIYKANQLVVGKKADGTDLTLDYMINGAGRLREVAYPRIRGDREPRPSEVKSRKNILKRVFKALNDKKQVILTFHVDFNAVDISNGMFDYQTLVDAGKPGRQGGHMVVLEDYVVDNVPDGQGGFMSIEEGDVSQELKLKAIEGDLRYFVVKNSWGSNRPERGIVDGKTRLHIDYLNKPIDVTDDEGEVKYKLSSLQSFHLPPGY